MNNTCCFSCDDTSMLWIRMILSALSKYYKKATPKERKKYIMSGNELKGSQCMSMHA